MNNFKKKLEKDWGKKCEDFSLNCAVCIVWRAFEVIEQLYEKKLHITNWEKILKKDKKEH